MFKVTPFALLAIAFGGTLVDEASGDGPGRISLNYSYLPNSSGVSESGTVQIPLQADKCSTEMRASLYAMNAGRAIQQFLSDWHHKQEDPRLPATDFQLNSLVAEAPAEVPKTKTEPVTLKNVPDYRSGPGHLNAQKFQQEEKKHLRGKRYGVAVRTYAANLETALRKVERENGQFEPALQDQFQHLNVDLLSLAAAFEDPVAHWPPPVRYSPLRSINGGTVYIHGPSKPTGSLPLRAGIKPNVTPSVGTSLGSPSHAAPASHGGMALTSGGVMTDKGFWAKVAGREIPPLADFNLEGFLKRFRLHLTTVPDGDGKHLAVAMGEGLYFPETGRILVQVSMAALANEETYKRPPLNLAIGIDISGSMSTVDAIGGGLTRMDGARQATIEMLKKLRSDDQLSIFVFDDVVEMLVRKTSIRSPEELESIISKVNSLKPRHLTDIGRAQEFAYDLLKDMAADTQPGREGAQNRFVLVTDAMVTHGELNENELKKKVQAAAAKGNYTTVVGVGRGFSQSLSEKLATETGGMFFFAASGEELVKLFRNFDTRMVTFATQFTVSMKADGFPGKVKLVATVGSGVTDNSAALKPGDVLDGRTVLEVPTLAFADLETLDPAAGGGAFLIELQLTPNQP